MCKTEEYSTEMYIFLTPAHFMQLTAQNSTYNYLINRWINLASNNSSTRPHIH